MAGKMGRLKPFVALIAAVVGIWMAWTAASAGAPTDSRQIGRFFFSGDGRISLLSKKNGTTFSGRYRRGRSDYDPKALAAIHRVFGATFDPHHPKLSLRMIEFLDFVEDHLRPGARLTITSGYRSPQYNKRLRRRGALAAKASLHQYGMAADLEMEGVGAWRIWNYVKSLGFGGTGYYHGDSVHIDVGPTRSWDEKTSGVGTGLSDDNKLVGLICDYDRYRPSGMITLRFIRMTAFPVGVARQFQLVRMTRTGKFIPMATFTPALAISAGTDCACLADMDQMANISWQLPQSLPPGRYRVRARFCDNPWPKMPLEAITPEFEIVGVGPATRHLPAHDPQTD